MTASDFLWGGSPPPTATAKVTTQTGMPDWYQSYTQGLLAKSNQIADNTPNYYANLPAGVGGVAEVNPQQQQAWQMTGQNVGNYQPYFNAGANDLTGAMGTTGQSMGTLGAAAGTIGAGANTMGDVASLGGGVNSNAFSSYMNPYNQNVTDAIANLGQRNLTQNLLPQVNDTFIGSGQFGSSRNSDFTQRAVQNANESILNQQAQALQSGYNSSMGNYLTGQGQQLSAGQGLAQAGQALTGVGAGQTANANTAVAAGQQMGALGQAQQAGGLKDVASLDAAGQEQQAQQQNVQNWNYNNYINQAQFPAQMAQFMNQQIRGFNPPTSTTSTTTAPLSTTSNPSGLQALGTAASSVGALSKLFGG